MLFSTLDSCILVPYVCLLFELQCILSEMTLDYFSMYKKINNSNLSYCTCIH